jgi:hypothetical protein
MSDRAEALRNALISIERETSLEMIKAIAKDALDRDFGRQMAPTQSVPATQQNRTEP